MFDINVVERERENGYNVTPVVSKSGVVGEDVDVEKVTDDEGNGDADDDTEEMDDESN